ncbi:MAG: hypothetical protein SGILL_001756, partial [Bacillariaceae sp.]
YFGILTADMDMFVFESQDAFERVKAWSRYFSYRTELAEELLEAFDHAEDEEDTMMMNGDDMRNSSAESNEVDVDQAQSLFLHSSTNIARAWVLVNEEEGSFPTIESGKDVRSMLRVDAIEARTLTVKAEGGLYELFGGTKPGTTGINQELPTQLLSHRLRQDFAKFVHQSLPPHKCIEFKLTAVERLPSSSRSGSFERKPVIIIERANSVEQDSSRATTMAIMTNPDQSLPLPSTVKLTEDIEPTSEGSLEAHANRWRMPSEDHLSQYSPHTKTTLAGEGIHSINTPDESPLEKKVLFLDECPQKQPQFGSDCSGASPTTGLQIKTRADDPGPTSPKSLLVQSGVDDVGNRNQKAERQFERTMPSLEVTPIHYLNTDFGDLRSVTSILTEPAFDASANPYLINASNAIAANAAMIRQEDVSLDIGKREAAKRIVQRRMLENSGESADPTEVGQMLNRSLKEAVEHLAEEKHKFPDSATWIPDDNTEQAPSPSLVETISSTHSQKSEATNSASEAADPMIPGKGQHTVAQRQASTGNADPWTEFGTIISGLCEAVVNVAPNSDRVQAPGATEPSSSSASKENETPFSGCPCRQDPQAILVDSATSEWIPSVSVENDVKSSTEESLNPEMLIEGAKKLGRDLSVQFDALLRMALDGTGEVQSAVAAAMAPIPEDGTVLALDDFEKPVEITTKKHKQMGIDSYGIPKSQSFECDPLAESSVPLPPHQPRRSKNKIAVARKKQSSSSSKPKPEAPSSMARPVEAAYDVSSRHSRRTRYTNVSVSSLSESTDRRKMLT